MRFLGYKKLKISGANITCKFTQVTFVYLHTNEIKDKNKRDNIT